MRSLPFALIDNWRSPAPAAQRVAWIGAQAYAHRGLHGPGVAENSLTAFDFAIRAGVGIECDIQRSADDRAMVFHDWELDRLTAKRGLVGARESGFLGRLALGDSGDCMPTLDTVLDRVAGQVPLLIEIKSKQAKRIGPVCLAVRRALQGYEGHHAVMSFDPRVPNWFANHAPRTIRGLVVTEKGEKGLRGLWKRHAALWHARPNFLAYDIRDLPSGFAAAQRKRGLPVVTWTVRNAEQHERAARHADAPVAEGEGFG